jgi:hypothetical protein
MSATAPAVERQHVADQGICRPVGADPPQGVPRADVAPADVGVHDRVIEGNLRALRKGLVLEAEKVEVLLGRLQSRPAGGDDVRLQALHLLDEPPGLEQKHAAVPGEVAALQIGLGRRGIRLLDELGDREAARRLGKCLGALDVAVAGLRPVGGDAEASASAWARLM